MTMNKTLIDKLIMNSINKKSIQMDAFDYPFLFRLLDFLSARLYFLWLGVSIKK